MGRDVHAIVKKTLGNKHACYVLITCEHPAPDGKMEVALTYQGDAALAAYLLEGAQGYLDHEQEECARCGGISSH